MKDAELHARAHDLAEQVLQLRLEAAGAYPNDYFVIESLQAAQNGLEDVCEIVGERLGERLQ